MFGFIPIFHTVAGAIDFLTLLGVATVHKRVYHLLFGILWVVLCALTAYSFNPMRHGEIMLAVLALIIHLPIMLVGMAGITLFHAWKNPRSRSITLWLRLAGMLLIAILLPCVGWYAHYVEPYQLEVTHEVIHSPKITQKVRIVFAADFQANEIGDYEKNVLHKIAKLKPDLVLWGGDLFQPGLNDVLGRRGFQAISDYRKTYQWQKKIAADFQQAWKDSGISPPLGSWFIQGNHDITYGIEPELPNAHWFHATVQRSFRDDLDITFLSQIDSLDNDEHTTIYPPSPDPNRYHLIVGHYPGSTDNPTLSGDILLAGHTHGGQLQIPFLWDILRKMLHSPALFRCGWYTGVSGVPCYTSRGIGMARVDTPEYRLHCRPELLLLELEPESSAKTPP